MWDRGLTLLEPLHQEGNRHSIHCGGTAFTVISFIAGVGCTLLWASVTGTRGENRQHTALQEAAITWFSLPMAAAVTTPSARQLSSGWKSSAPVARLFAPDAAPATAKIVYFVRHAEGTHNVAADRGHSREHWDAQLTEKGREQCEALRQRIASTLLRTPIECVLVSPCTRTLQTAHAVFQEVLDSDVPVVAEESWRETVNYCCDARRELFALKSEFPFVDFSHVASEKDPIWEHYATQFGDHQAYQEHRESADLPGVANRLRQALSILALRPERSIAVVTHQAILMHLLNRHSNPGLVEFADDDFKQTMQADWGNCELRTAAFDFSDDWNESVETVVRPAETDADGVSLANSVSRAGRDSAR